MNPRSMWRWLAARLPQRGAAMTSGMAPYVGRRHGVHTLADGDYLTPEQARGVRAYPVPGLVGALISAEREGDLPAALEADLARQLPIVAWRVERDIAPALRAYGLLHTSMVAPADAGEPMWLELSGDVTMLGGQPLPAERSWLDLRPMSKDDRLETEIPGPVQVRIRSATYANHQFPGVGVPLYL